MAKIRIPTKQKTKITNVIFFVCEPGTDTTGLASSMYTLIGHFSKEEAQAEMVELFPDKENLIHVQSVYQGVVVVDDD